MSIAFSFSGSLIQEGYPWSVQCLSWSLSEGVECGWECICGNSVSNLPKVTFLSLSKALFCLTWIWNTSLQLWASGRHHRTGQPESWALCDCRRTWPHCEGVEDRWGVSASVPWPRVSLCLIPCLTWWTRQFRYVGLSSGPNVSTLNLKHEFVFLMCFFYVKVMSDET